MTLKDGITIIFIFLILFWCIKIVGDITINLDKRIERIEEKLGICPHGDSYDDCPDCRH
jgi:uncharacterized protein YjaG (DUF416 family)